MGNWGDRCMCVYVLALESGVLDYGEDEGGSMGNAIVIMKKNSRNNT